jgi:DNA-binding NtrC family response regulator
MSSRYDPRDHIQPLVIPPRAEGILDQREITIHSYQTTVPFNFDALNAALENAWLTPQTRFGVFSRIPYTHTQALNVVLGLQDDLRVRAYDYDERRPIWFSWCDVIVETANVHYSRDKDGLLRITTTGRGRRITDDRLHEFNSAFLGISKAAVTKRQFDLQKLRELCFKRFDERVHMIRFREPSAQQYRSIDHALFQSRQYIDPNAERLQEISTDKRVKIESFESDIPVLTDELATSIRVRFLISGLSGSLRLRFPKVPFRSQLKTPEDQAIVFYRLADATENAILDDDYYTHQPRSLDELSADLGMFPEIVDLTPFREWLSRPEARREFLLNIDLSEGWSRWDPQLRVISELLESDVIVADVKACLDDLVRRVPGRTTRLLAVCQDDARKYRLGHLVARALASQLQAIPAEMRAHVEEAILSWAIDREQDSWDVDADSNEFSMLNLKWRIDDLAFDVLPIVLWKVLGVLHSRLMISTGDIGPLLHKFHWCISAARTLPAHHSRSCAALRLVSAERTPNSIQEASRVLQAPVSDLRALDNAVLAQFGLPLWPRLTASRRDGKVTLSNDGIGAALALKLHPEGQLPPNTEQSIAFDLLAGGSVALELSDKLHSIDMCFEKLGKTCHLRVPIVAESSPVKALDTTKSLPLIVNQKRLKEQRAHRAGIDREGIVVGASPAVLQLFERIRHANLMEGPPSVLLLGEPGVGKTHLAKLLHDSSSRATQPFKAVNAGGGGGDVNIQRGEWIGFGKGHGIQGIDKNGRAGHLMHANGGTLFIDEFDALSHDLQVIFLSVLEKRSIEKIGGESFIPDVRCIFATNADVEKEVERGALRRDLLARIPVVIPIPALRERGGDILLLAKHFSKDHKISDRCLVALFRYPWPGNVRELQNKVAAAKAKTNGQGKNAIGLEHFDLPADIVSAVEGLDDESCRRELWIFACQIARDEGFEQGSGLQRRVGEIIGVGEAQASKMFHELGLTTDNSVSLSSSVQRLSSNLAKASLNFRQPETTFLKPRKSGFDFPPARNDFPPHRIAFPPPPSSGPNHCLCQEFCTHSGWHENCQRIAPITGFRMSHTQQWQSYSAKRGEVNMSTGAPTMPTIGEIARRLGEPHHRIEYVIRSRGICPSGWAGNARIFSENAVEEIAMELKRIDSAKHVHNQLDG